MAASEEQYAYAEINRFIVYVLYALSFLVGIPLNGYIIYRLYARIGKKSYYYRLLMLMSAVDMYIAFFNTVVYYNNRVSPALSQIQLPLVVYWLLLHSRCNIVNSKCRSNNSHNDRSYLLEDRCQGVGSLLLSVVYFGKNEYCRFHFV